MEAPYTKNRLNPIRGVVKNYEWGKRGDKSLVASFAENWIDVDSDTPYAGMLFHINLY